MILRRNGKYKTREGDIVRHLVEKPRIDMSGGDWFPWYATLEDRKTGKLYQQWYSMTGRWSLPKSSRKPGDPDLNISGADLVEMPA